MRALRPEEIYGDDVITPGKGAKNMSLRRRKALARAIQKGVSEDEILQKTSKHHYRMKYNHDLIDNIIFLDSKGLTNYDIELLMGITREVITNVLDGKTTKEDQTSEEFVKMIKTTRYRTTHGQEKVIEAARKAKERDLEIYRDLRNKGYAS